MPCFRVLRERKKKKKESQKRKEVKNEGSLIFRRANDTVIICLLSAQSDTSLELATLTITTFSTDNITINLPVYGKLSILPIVSSLSLRSREGPWGLRSSINKSITPLPLFLSSFFPFPPHPPPPPFPKTFSQGIREPSVDILQPLPEQSQAMLR